MITSRCRTPLMRLCDSDSRIKVKIAECDQDTCNPEVTKLCLEQQGCTKYETVCVEEEVSHGCGCPSIITQPKWVQREVPKPFVCYPLLEVDDDGMAVFVLDDTLKDFGYGRYRATVYFNDCACISFDVDYTCGTPRLSTVTTEKYKPCGTS